jgi:hypothetical protein
MSRNPSDVYSKLPGSVAVSGAVVDSSDYNDQIDDIVNALNDVAMLSGSKPFTGDQSMGTNQLTSVGDGAAIQDAATVAQVQNGVVQHATAVAGTADAIQVTMTPAKTTWVSKERIRWTSGGANTVTTPTISKDAGSTTKTIKKGAGAALAVGDTGASGYICEGVYNGTDLILLNPAGTSASASTTTQELTGTSTAVYSTPDSGAALWEAGADITDGAAITIGEGGYFNLITSTTAITSFSITTDKAGRTFRVRFDTARTLTHNGTSLIIPGAANITTAQGDIAQIRSLGSGNVVVDWYTKASGLPVVAPASGGMTLLSTLTTTSGTTQSATGLAASTYRKYYIEIDGVSFTSNAALTVAISGDNGSNYGTAVTISAASTADAQTRDGAFEIGGINIPTRYGANFLGGSIQVSTASGTAGPVLTAVILGKATTGATGAVDAIRFAGGTFDAGEIRIYGVK